MTSVPPDVAGRFASEIQLSVEDALQGVGPGRPRAVVERLVRAAVERVVEPWRREQQRKQDISAAANVAADPFRVPGLLGYRESQILAQERALRAILALPESVTVDQMVVAGRAAALQVAQEHQEQRERARAQQDRDRAQQKREGEVDGYLFNVLPYLRKCDIDFEGEDPYLCAERIKRAIRPKLIDDPSLNFLNAEQRVRELVDEWINSTEANAPKLKTD